ncbi:MAG: restriction endonuclease [candidate division Zixibacteria bacterium]|jgi:restriction endonuclease Mrr|nr:restriction endonuclease [candidate division Zixibacteria bacterium]
MEPKQAFVLRIAPGGVDLVQKALSSDQIVIGWTEAEGLLDESLDWESFREIVRRAYYANEDNLRLAGGAAGHLWRFIREMNIGDLVVVPYGSDFYVARVEGPAKRETFSDGEYRAYRRQVTWLNNKEPIPRSSAQTALISRMKTQGTCARATDLLQEIVDCLKDAEKGRKPSFRRVLQGRLVSETLHQLRTGHIDSFGFENLIKETLEALGAREARVVPRNKDKGADVVAEFLIAGAITQTVAVQAKHFYRPEPPVDPTVIDQLVRGMEAEGADLGMIVTCGTISEEARARVEKLHEEDGINIELVDGEQFAKIIVENGIGPVAVDDEVKQG